jgi:ABC-2 type transport system ATP-binding protein
MQTFVETTTSERHASPPGAVVVRGLRKSYGEVTALDGVDLTIRSGEVFGLLGPNGAGKTTLVEILEGHRARDGGAVSVLGFDPQTRSPGFRDRIGVVLQEGDHIPTTTVAEAVRLYAAAYPHPRDTREVVELVGLADKSNARIGTLSGGQRRRLDLALGIAGDPDLIFLDEPTTGFDPSARRRSWELVENLRTLGKTILLTTHYMDEAQHLADRVAVIASGRIVAEGSPDEIGGRGRTAVVEFRLPDGVGLGEIPVEGSAQERDGHLVLQTDRPTVEVAALTSWAARQGLELPDLTVTRPTLEDVYLSLTDGEPAP